jgi:alkaline phosphatase
LGSLIIFWLGNIADLVVTVIALSMFPQQIVEHNMIYRLCGLGCFTASKILGGVVASAAFYTLYRLSERISMKSNRLSGAKNVISYIVAGAGLSFIAAAIWNSANLLRLLKIF